MSSIPNPVPPLTGPESVHDLGSFVSEDAPGRRHKHKVSIRVAALNITAFMDLTFNLLLFFVLTASFSLPEGVLSATLPAGTGGGGSGSAIEPPSNPLVIALRSIGYDQVAIQIEGASASPASFEDLYARLRDWRYDEQKNPGGMYKPDNPILIKPDRNVPWRAVVDTFNAMVRARYSNVGFAPANR